MNVLLILNVPLLTHLECPSMHVHKLQISLGECGHLPIQHIYNKNYLLCFKLFFIFFKKLFLFSFSFIFSFLSTFHFSKTLKVWNNKEGCLEMAM